MSIKSTSEKNTDHLLLTKWTEIFGEVYNTGTNKELFNSLIPDGWQIIDNILFIIENKKELKNKNIAENQLLKYINLVKTNNKFEQFKDIYLIFGFGDKEINFSYSIYKYENSKLVKNNLLLENIKENMNITQLFDEKEIHDFNKHLYNTCPNVVKSQKTLFVASILLTLYIDPNFLKDYNPDKPGFIIALKMLELIQNYFNDEVFTNQFNFLKKSLNNKYLYELINKISIDVKKYGKDILNKFYSEFCKYDKNDDSKVGVVLTPSDIVELMVKELNIKDTDTVLDFCTGTGSFLLEAGKYTKHLIGCECNEERFTLTKCNFILNGYDYKRLYHNSCFNQEFPKVDKSIINPPFSCDIPDEDIKENITNWKSYNEEQKFLLYQVQCLKEGGLGACIIPRSNFNNNVKQTNEFKKELLHHIKILKIINCNSKIFKPAASSECAIIIYQRMKTTNKIYISSKIKVIDYTNDGYDINKNARIKIKEPELKEQVRKLSYNDDWNYINQINEDLNVKLLLQQDLLTTFNKQINECINQNNSPINIIKDFEQKMLQIDNIKIKEWINIKIKDYFNSIVPSKIFQIKKAETGNYPLISSSGLNNGITKYINDYSYDGECLSIARNGTVGSCFVQSGKFGITTDIILLKAKSNNKYNLHTFAPILTYYLKQKYTYTNKLSKPKLMEETIKYPVFEKELNI